MAKHKRMAVTVQLVHGQDDDLIDFVQGIENGYRNNVLKRYLRQALSLPLPEDDLVTAKSTDDNIAKLREDIENSWNTLVAELPEHIRSVVQEQVDSQVQNTLSNLLMHGIDNNAVNSNEKSVISDEKKKKRRQNLSTQSW